MGPWHPLLGLSSGIGSSEFVFPLETIANFVSNERKFCPFVNFDLRVTAGSDRVVLRMTGPAGTRESYTLSFFTPRHATRR